MTDGSSRHCRSPFAAFQSPRIDLLPVTSRTTVLNDPSRYGRNREIPDNPYQHEYYVSRIRSIRYKIRVLQCHNILFQHQYLNTGKHRTEQVRNRQPQINPDIPGEPLRQRRLKSVIDGKSEGERPQNAQHD